MNILAIETSCDETSIALVKAKGNEFPTFTIHTNLVSSQIKIHRPFGGVVPNLAKREHIKNLPVLLKKLAIKISKSKIKNQKSKLQPKNKIENETNTIRALMKKIDVIAVTVGPGLEPALWTGINFAKELAKEYKKPLLGANHLEGHLYSFLLPGKKAISYKLKAKSFPAIGLIVSGGHTMLLVLSSLTTWKKIGETRDDAIGEAYDKVARMLGLQYPGGPEVERVAKIGDPASIKFPRPMLDQKNYDFSFSGLKTSVLYHLRDMTNHEITTPFIIPETQRNNIAASFQAAAIETLVQKTIRAVKEFNAHMVLIGGGVAANKSLANSLKKACKKESVMFIPPARNVITDNAAMIAAGAYINILQKKKRRIVAQSNLTL
ncbi:MAG: tRNA (adenosine(37)-N6)-threonylcarbamoyltransferase complex transferase subunit TsaD [Parcubacteria group bacterium]|nr:tRNA (adenosine(37)-N6)-threonylcarbamoyltransferase complex transferase subunit TsaD [Parcubacteria group bacterium]